MQGDFFDSSCRPPSRVLMPLTAYTSVTHIGVASLKGLVHISIPRNRTPRGCGTSSVTDSYSSLVGLPPRFCRTSPLERGHAPHSLYILYQTGCRLSIPFSKIFGENWRGFVLVQYGRSDLYPYAFPLYPIFFFPLRSFPHKAEAFPERFISCPRHHATAFCLLRSALSSVLYLL